MAVMLWLPAPAEVTAQVAMPASIAWLTQPAMLTPPSWKSTVPVGVPEPGALAVTVAVKVTLCPDAEGLTDELNAVVVTAWLTTCVSGAEVLGLKLASPL